MTNVVESRRVQQTFTIGEVAERTGLSVHALRYYERENLLIGPVRRSSGGRRLYTEADVEWLQYGASLRESGMPLSDLAVLTRLVKAGPGNERERLELLEAHLRRMDAQVEALERSRAIIEWKVGVYSDQLRTGSANGLWDPTQTVHAASAEAIESTRPDGPTGAVEHASAVEPARPVEHTGAVESAAEPIEDVAAVTPGRI